jgi:hypothetical protein
MTDLRLPASELLAQFGEQHVVAFFLVLARVTPLFVLAPLFSSKMVPARVRGIIAVALSVGLSPVVAGGRTLPTDPALLGALLGKELLIGGAFAFILAAFFAALQVYFRDTSSFLPFFVRVWMYLSPVLWTPDRVENILNPTLLTLVKLNPMYSMLGGYTELLQGDAFPPMYMWITALAWGLVVAGIGFLFFMSREREFTVRLV